MQYSEDEIQEYWGDIDNIIQKVPRKRIEMRNPDHNGQVSKTKNRDDAIGNWAMGSKHDRGNGGNLIESCIGNDMI